MDRQKVYKAIDSERDYQNRKWGNIQQHPHEVAGWLVLMRDHLRDAEHAWATRATDDSALDEIRKVLAIGVACCEQHGVTTRSKFTEPPPESMRH